VKFAFIAAEKAHYPIQVLCEVLGVTRSGFYAWRKRPVSPRREADAQLLEQVRSVHQRSRRTYGSPRIHRELRACGKRVGKKRIERLMRQDGLRGAQKRRFRKTTDSNHSQPVAPNLLARRFTAEQPNTHWVTDVTYLWTLEGWLYLAVMLDLFSRRVVSWAVSESNDTELAKAALERGLAQRKPEPGLVHHSDRGSPYASEGYRELEAEHGVVASMSRSGDCWDNAVSESFFATLRAELVDHEVYATRAAAKASVGDYIDNFYNLTRRHSTLGYLSPVEFELKKQAAALAA
jgi:putative transposase